MLHLLKKTKFNRNKLLKKLQLLKINIGLEFQKRKIPKLLKRTEA